MPQSNSLYFHWSKHWVCEFACQPFVENALNLLHSHLSQCTQICDWTAAAPFQSVAMHTQYYRDRKYQAVEIYAPNNHHLVRPILFVELPILLRKYLQLWIYKWVWYFSGRNVILMRRFTTYSAHFWISPTMPFLAWSYNLIYVAIFVVALQQKNTFPLLIQVQYKCVSSTIFNLTQK